MWFDEGELSTLAKAAPEALQVLDDERVPEIELLDAPGRLKACPRCQVRLESHRYAYDAPVVIDACPQCRGIFVEDRELEAITRVLRGEYRSRYSALIASRSMRTGAGGLAGPRAERNVAAILAALKHWEHHAGA